jgi:hypothetical protein
VWNRRGHFENLVIDGRIIQLVLFIRSQLRPEDAHTKQILYNEENSALTKKANRADENRVLVYRNV